MRLTRRDGVATALGLMGAVVVLAVLQGRDWLLLGSYLAGVVALAAIGVPTCMMAPIRSGTASRLRTHG